MCFCTKCGNRVKREHNFCRKCGNPLRKESKTKENEKSLNIFGNKLFMLVRMNWGLCAPNFKNRQTWIVYQDGHVCSTANYCGYGETESKYTTLKGQDLYKLRNFCDSIVKSNPKKVEGCCDGMGYEIVIYNADGTERYHFHGYIYGIEVLESVKDFILSIRGLYFAPYDFSSIR